jgi:hypothetical protein
VANALTHRGRDQLHQEVDRTAPVSLLAFSTNPLIAVASRGRRIDVHADARLEDEGEQQAERQRDGGHDLEVDQRLDADAADALQVAGAGDAVHHDAEHQHRDDHLDQLDEAVAQRLELDAELGQKKPTRTPTARARTTWPNSDFRNLGIADLSGCERRGAGLITSLHTSNVGKEQPGAVRANPRDWVRGSRRIPSRGGWNGAGRGSRGGAGVQRIAARA